MRARLIKLKRQDPHMKFRVEQNLGPKEDISVETHTETGLQAPESYFVSLEEYLKEHAEPEPDQIVTETIKGVSVAGVFWL